MGSARPKAHPRRNNIPILYNWMALARIKAALARNNLH